MSSNEELKSLFFHDLKQYNPTNFRAILRADLTQATPAIYKTFSSVITRYFIFCEHHPEIDAVSLRILFFDLKIDMIAKYFTEYSTANLQDLINFQTELSKYSDAKQGEPHELRTVTIYNQ